MLIKKDDFHYNPVSILSEYNSQTQVLLFLANYRKCAMTYKLALMPLLIVHAFAYAADGTAENEDKARAQTGAVLQEVNVTGQAQRSFSSASQGELRDRVNLGLLGRQNAFTAPVNVVNYDEKIIILFCNNACSNSCYWSDITYFVF